MYTISYKTLGLIWNSHAMNFLKIQSLFLQCPKNTCQGTPSLTKIISILPSCRSSEEYNNVL